jgi:hypothetical protein
MHRPVKVNQKETLTLIRGDLNARNTWIYYGCCFYDFNYD